MKHGIRKSDVILIIGILICAAGFYFFQANREAEPNAQLVVKVNGEIVKTCSLKENQIFWLPGKTNQVLVHDGRVSMKEADCPDQICVNHVPIYRNHESIICLPNQVVLEIVNGEESGLDAVTN